MKIKLVERQWVTVGLFGLAVFLLVMAWVDPKLWEVEVYKVIIQAVILTGILNMVTSFHFSANTSDDAKVENTAKAFDAITATAKAQQPVDAPTGTYDDPVHVKEESA